MAINLNKEAVERSTAKVTVVLYDEDGAVAIPNSLTWTLSNSSGTVINNRQDVALTPASSMSFYLSGDDLVIASDDPVRLIYLEGTYTDSTAQSRPYVEEFMFRIRRTVNG